MYDGVRTHGLVHQLRMEEVFWGRMRILLKAIDLFVVALPTPTSQEHADRVMNAYRALDETIYAGKRESREEREKNMAKVLARETQKNYEVTPLEEG